MIKEILEMTNGKITVAAVAAAFLLILTIKEGLSKSFYEKGFRQVMGMLVAVEVIKEFCASLQVGTVLTVVAVVLIAALPAAVFQARDCSRMHEKKKEALKKAHEEVRKAERAVDRVKAAKKERAVRRSSIFRYAAET